MPDTEVNSQWIGFDLGGTKMMAVVFDSNFKVLSREKKKTKSANEQVLSIDRICKVISSAIENAQSKVTKIAGIGVGAPGTLNLEQGVILEAPNLGWKNFKLQEMLQKEFGCPVTLCNDVDAGIYGEYKRGAAQNARCALGVFPGTGIGGGLVYNGMLFTGKTNSALEIGHFPVIPDGVRCGCGRFGCLETVASRLAISAAAAAAVYRGEAPVLQGLCGTDLTNIKSGMLAEAIKAGDKVIEDIVVNAACHLGRILGGVINLLTPDKIVLGGGLVEALPSIFLKNVEQSARKFVMPSFDKLYSITTAMLGDDATATGAAAWARTISQARS